MNASLATAALAFVAIAVPTSASAAAAHRDGQLPSRSGERQLHAAEGGPAGKRSCQLRSHGAVQRAPRSSRSRSPTRTSRARGTSTPAIPTWTATATGAGTATCSAAARTRRASTTTLPTRSARGRWSSPTASGRSPWRCSTTRARSTSTCSASGARLHADGVNLDGIYISSNHDESAPDTIGISGVNAATSSVNAYFANYMVQQSAKAIEDAVASQRSADDPLRGGEGAVEPAPVLVVVSLRRRPADAEPAGGRHRTAR